MELRARLVLSDCRWALSQYSEASSAEPLRVSWVSVITLLRAVGHVLDKVDAGADPDIREVVAEKWKELRQTRPKPEILWDFIDSERNSVVKEYEFGFTRKAAGEPLPGQGGYSVEVDLLSMSGGTVHDAPKVLSRITEGPFCGRPEKEVAGEGIRWWENCLDDIENRVAQKKANRGSV